MACTDGSPTYCLISARSTNAKSIAAVMLEVVSIITLGYLKHKHDFYDIRSAATTVLYIFKKFQAVLLFQVQNFM
jgi:hypothetical protein